MRQRPFVIGLALSLLALAALLLRPATPQIFELWVLAGQSNMAGNFTQADVERLDTALREQPAVAYTNASPAICPVDRAVWGSLRPLCGTYTPRSFGPELSFGQRLAAAAPEHRIAIVKYARNDSSLHDDWRPGAVSDKCAPDGPSCYDALIRAVGFAVNDLRARNPGARVELAGIVWVQGETDADPARAGAAAAYAENLRALILALRDDLAPLFDSGANGPPLFIYSRLHRDTFFGAAAEVRAAQESLAADPARPERTLMVDADTVALGPDRLHFTADGQIQLGRLLAEAAQAPHTGVAGKQLSGVFRSDRL